MYSTLVRGTYPRITFRHNLEALDKGLFELFGKLVAIAIINGCPGPHFFTRMVTGVILDIPQEPDLDEVPHECEFLTKLKTISSCCDEASFLDAVNSFPERFDMGYTKATVTLEDKNDLLKACIKHIVIYSTAEEIYSFRKGLASFGVKELLCRFPSDGIKKLMHVEVSVEDVKAAFYLVFQLQELKYMRKKPRLFTTILVPRATRIFLNYVSCSSGNGQKFIFFDWLIQTVCAITLKFFGFYA